MSGESAVALLGVGAEGVGSDEDSPEAVGDLRLELVEDGDFFVVLDYPADDGADFEVGTTFLVDLDEVAVRFEGLDVGEEFHVWEKLRGHEESTFGDGLMCIYDTGVVEEKMGSRRMNCEE